MPTVAFSQLSSKICCPRDCVSRHNGGTSGAPLKPLRVDSALRALLTLRGSRGAPEAPPLCRETQSLGQQMLNAPFGINGLMRENIGRHPLWRVLFQWSISKSRYESQVGETATFSWETAAAICDPWSLRHRDGSSYW